MKVDNLVESIREALVEKCSNRALDDIEDFEAVMEVIDFTVEGWLAARCKGCK